MVLLSFPVCAQEETEYENYQEKPVFSNKNGIPILPSQGNIAFGTGASPFLTYLGNMFNSDEMNSLTFSEPYIIIKSFVEDKKAYRLKIGANFSYHADKQFVRDDYAAIADTLSTKQVIDQQNKNQNSVYLQIGIEKRRGNARIQGFYGAGPHVAFTKFVENYSYGNPMSEANPNPSSFDFQGYNNILNYGRVIKQNNGYQWNIGVNAFIGVEYFILPKFSIGTQADLNILYGFSGNVKRDVEVWENGKAITVTELLSPGDRNFDVFTAHTSLNMFLMFHF